MKFDFNSLEETQKKSTGFQKTERKVGYFKLADGQEAIIRFPYTSPKDFDIVTIHKIKVTNGDKTYYRDISCLKEHAYDDASKCPLCSLPEGDDRKKVSYRFYVKLIEYVTDKDTGTIKPVAKIWSKGYGFAKELKSYFDEYGDISNYIFKVKRTGKGLEDTKYTILPANPAIYKPELYVKNFDDFKDLDLTHHSYMSKNEDEIKEFLKTGSFPFNKKTEETKPAAEVKADVKEAVPFDETPFDTPAAVAENKPAEPTSTLRQPRKTYSF